MGFPGETKEQFEELLDFVKECRFDRLGAFAYSKEEGTAAANLKGHLPERIKKRRWRRLMELSKKISLQNNTQKIGSVVEVLCEGYDEKEFLYYGRSRADSPDIDGRVYFAAKRDVGLGEFVKIKVLCAQEYDIVGEMVE